MINLDLLIVLAYFFFSLILGISFSRRTSNMSEYALGLGNYSVGGLVVLIFSCWVGAGLTFGVAEYAFYDGLFALAAPLGGSFCLFLCGRYIVEKMPRFHEMTTVGDIMQIQYGVEGKIVSGIAGTLISVLLISVQLKALAQTLFYFFQIPKTYGLLLGLIVLGAQATIGGLRAIIKANTLKFITLLIAIPTISHISISYLGGPQRFWLLIPDSNPLFETRYPLILLLFLIPFLSPETVQRLLMEKNTRKLKHAFYMSAFVIIPFFLAVCIIGITASIIQPSLPSTDAMLYVIDNVLPSGSKGFVLAGLLAIFLGTGNAYLNTASIALVHDILLPLGFNRNKELSLMRLSTLFLAPMVFAVSLHFTSLLDAVVAAWSLWACLISAPLYATLFQVKIEKTSFHASLLSGFTTLTLWGVLGLYDLLNVHALLPGLLASAFTLLAFQFKFRQLLPLLHQTKTKFSQVMTDRLPQYQTILSLAKPKTLITKLKNICTAHPNHWDSKYTLFPSFAILTYILPYFVWNEIRSDSPLSSSLWIIGGLLCAVILIKDCWVHLAPRFFLLCWNFTLLYCLPFLNTYLTLDHHVAPFWLINLGLSLFILAALVHWLCFLLFLCLGIGAGIAVFELNHFSNPWQIDAETIFLFVYFILFSSAIGLFFTRNRTDKLEQKKKTLKALSAAIAHEMRTPLSGLLLGVSGMKRYMPSLLHGWELSQKQGIPVGPISAAQYRLAKTVSHDFYNTIQKALLTIDMVLIKLREYPQTPGQILSMSAIIEKSLKSYPFSSQDRNFVHWDRTNDFSFLGHEDLMQHVLFNLLKNSLEPMKNQPRGLISIWLTTTPTKNQLHFRDSTKRTSPDQSSDLFGQTAMDMHQGLGKDLAFCHSVMQNFDGTIESSTKDQCVYFVLSFPKQKSHFQKSANTIKLPKVA